MELLENASKRTSLFVGYVRLHRFSDRHAVFLCPTQDARLAYKAVHDPCTRWDGVRCNEMYGGGFRICLRRMQMQAEVAIPVDISDCCQSPRSAEVGPRSTMSGRLFQICSAPTVNWRGSIRCVNVSSFFFFPDDVSAQPQICILLRSGGAIQAGSWLAWPSGRTFNLRATRRPVLVPYPADLLNYICSDGSVFDLCNESSRRIAE